jgi:hypothetical protein
MNATQGGGYARSYPEPFLVTGPLLSLVFRTEDVWQRCNQFIETPEFSIRVSSHSYRVRRGNPCFWKNDKRMIIMQTG